MKTFYKLLLVMSMLVLFSGCVTLNRAVSNKDEVMVRQMVEKGDDIHALDGAGRSPTLNAAYHGTLNILNYLVEKGGDINFRDRRGRTGLIYAAYYNYHSILEFLAEKGADLNIQDDHGFTALHYTVLWTPAGRYVAEGQRSRPLHQGS